MDVQALVDQIADGNRVQDLTRPTRSLATNLHYRIWRSDGSVLLKIYGTPARERRETHAIEALAGIDGIPTRIEGDGGGELSWALFADPGQWSLASLSSNPGTTRRAGEILRAVHESDPSKLSNLTHGIDQEWIKIDFAATMRRLERYRRRIGMDAELYAAAAAMQPPKASATTAAHTDPTPEHFAIGEDGSVTLMDWEWATLAPPEWDLSKAAWLMQVREGTQAARVLQDGYGRTLDPIQLDRWVVYHGAMALVFEAEQHMPDASALSYGKVVDEIRRAVAASGR